MTKTSRGADATDPCTADRVLNRDHPVGRIVYRIFDSWPIGVALLSGEAAVLGANRVARDLIDAGEGLDVSSGTLKFDRIGGVVDGRDLVAEAMSSKDAKSDCRLAVAVPRKGGKRPLAALLVVPHDGPPGSGEPVAVLYLADPDRPTTVDQVCLRAFYGLSRAEARVAALLASGLRLEEISDAIGIKYETTRKHIKQIFDKMGADRQAEVVRILLSSPSIFIF